MRSTKQVLGVSLLSLSAFTLSTIPPSAATAATGELASDAAEPFKEDPHIDFTNNPSVQQIREVTDRIDAIDVATTARNTIITSPDGVDFAGAAGDYTLHYMTSVPSGHAAVFEAVMDEWADSVDFNGGGIRVEVHYQSLGSGALAGASHFSVIDSSNGVLFAIPTALRNADRGSDQFPATPDIVVYVNSDQNWSTAIGASIGNSQYSLYATLLHEIGHGLGFSSDVEPGSGSNDIFSALDQRLYRDGGTGTSTGPSAPIRTTTSPVVTTGRHWLMNLDGTWERIYDPTSGYQTGSSMSHFDENTYPGFGPGALMTPTLFNGETAIGVDGVVLGAMEIIGWTVETAPVAPGIVSTVVIPGQVTVNVTPSTSSSGPPASGWVVTITSSSGAVVATSGFPATDRALVLPVHLTDGTYTVSARATGSGGTSSATTRAVSVSGQGAAPTYTNCRRAPVNPAFGTTDETSASVYRLYCAYFLRYPDMGGFNYWLSEFGTQARTLDDISEFFAISPEFNTTYGSLSDTQFVDLIYTNILERDPDSVGYNFWIGELQSGSRSRGWLMLFFSQSDEFRTKTGTS